MRYRFSDRRTLVLGVLACACAAVVRPPLRAEEPQADDAQRKPATVAEASARLALVHFPLLGGAAEARQRGAAVLNYVAPGTVRDMFAKLKQQLAEQKWEPTGD